MLDRVDDVAGRDGAPEGSPIFGRATDAEEHAGSPAQARRRSCCNPQVEQDALALLQRGEENAAFGLLMRTYEGPLTGFVTRTLRDPIIAEDICQQVFTEAFVDIEKFEGRGTLWGWLCKIAYHRCMDHIRRSGRTVAVELDVLEALAVTPDSKMSLGELRMRKALEKCLGKLEPELLTQVLMRMSFDLSHEEIGAIVGAKAGTVQVRISRILPELRKCLIKEGAR